MLSSFIFKLKAIAASTILGFVLLASAASADVGWIIQPSTAVSMNAGMVLPEWDPNVDLNPDTNHALDPNNLPTLNRTTGLYSPEVFNSNSATYVPPIVIKSVAQTDVGTSGNPGLPNPVNSLSTGGTGYFTTVGNVFTQVVDFGGPPDDISGAHFVANNSGNWLPNQDTPWGNGNPDPSNPGGPNLPTNTPNQTYGAATPANVAATLVRTSPLDGRDNASATYGGGDPHGFAKAPTDVGRLALFGVQTTPVDGRQTIQDPNFPNDPTKTITVNITMPVTNGAFDASTIGVFGQFGVSLNWVEKSLDQALYNPDVLTGSLPFTFTPDTIQGTLSQTLTGTAALGHITRNGPQYVMTIPYTTSTVINQVTIGLQINTTAVANLQPGDTNFDGIVDIQDITQMANHWMQTNALHLGDGDANGDGIVDIQDVVVAANHWLRTSPALGGGGGGSIASVPEPSSLLLLVCGASIGLWIARRRSVR